MSAQHKKPTATRATPKRTKGARPGRMPWDRPRAKPATAPPAPEQELLPLADYDAVFEFFAAALEDGRPRTVDALAERAEVRINLEVSSATVREVVRALVEAGICTRQGKVLTPSAAAAPHLPAPVPSPAPVASTPATSTAEATAPGEKRIRDREAWMRRFVKAVRPWFAEIGAPLPEQIRLTMSLTRGARVVAVCYSRAASADGTNEILVRLDQATPLEIADHVLHELVHAADDCQSGHKGPFKRIARALGLVGPMKSTKLGDEARRRCEAIIVTLGPFPHAALDLAGGRRSGPSRQKNRHVKALCTQPAEGGACGYACRLSRAWIERGGPPICPIHEEPMTVEGDDEDGEGLDDP